MALYNTAYGFPGGSKVKASACNEGDLGLIPGLGRSLEKDMQPRSVLLPGESMDGGAWWATVQGVPKSWTRLSDFTFTFTTLLMGFPGDTSGKESAHRKY